MEMTCDMQVFSCTLSKVKVAKSKKVLFSFLSHLRKKVRNYCPSSFLVWLKGWLVDSDLAQFLNGTIKKMLSEI